MRQTYDLDIADGSQWFIVSAGQDARERLPYVQEVGDFIAREKYFTEREGLPSYLIKYTLSGEGRLVYEGRDAYVPQGCFYWIDCQKAQYYCTSERAGNWRVLWVHCYGAECDYLYQRFLAANGGNVGELPPNNAVASHIYELISLYGDAPEPNADVRAASLLMAVMAECICGAVGRSGAVQPKYVREAQDYMLAHFHEPVTLDTLAGEIAVNKYYLQKLFTRHAGLSPAAYLKAVRIARAKELLRRTELPVSAVAAQTGVETVSHFIKLFKAHEGVTPGEYRRLWRTRPD